MSRGALVGVIPVDSSKKVSCLPACHPGVECRRKEDFRSPPFRSRGEFPRRRSSHSVGRPPGGGLMPPSGQLAQQPEDQPNHSGYSTWSPVITKWPSPCTPFLAGANSVLQKAHAPVSTPRQEEAPNLEKVPSECHDLSGVFCKSRATVDSKIIGTPDQQCTKK